MLQSPPKSTEQLVRNARKLAGLRLAHVAEQLGQDVPRNLNRHKGWIGRLFEEALGADGGNDAAADFSELGVELKTIPVDRSGRPRETTFVCSVPLADPDEVTWETSTACAKLSKVLWVPILCGDELAVADRMVGSALLWSPSPEEQKILVSDWREHMDVIRRGYVDEITARDGEALQIRPKGATADSRTWSVGPDGESMLTLPRGFYLRSSFTASILEDHFAIAS